LESLPALRIIGKRLMERIERNNSAIVGINTALIGLSLSGTLSASTAALLHNSSTVAISMSAMRPLIEEAQK